MNIQNKSIYCGDAKVLAELAKRLVKISVDNEWTNGVSDLKNQIYLDYKNMLGAYKDFPEIIRNILPKRVSG